MARLLVLALVLFVGIQLPPPYYRGHWQQSGAQCQEHAPQAQCERRWPPYAMETSQ